MDAATALNQAVRTLIALRAAVNMAEDLYKWTSGISADELTAAPPNGLGMTQATADGLLSSAADAHALAEYYNTGVPPISYPQPNETYVYGASQRRLIGPRLN